MNRRLELHNILVGLLGSNHVYYQPPESLKMEYPCIRYNRSNINSGRADNINYRNMNHPISLIYNFYKRMATY